MLSAMKVNNAKPAERPYKILDARGLYMIIMPNGARYWRVNYRFQKKQRTRRRASIPTFHWRSPVKDATR
ncbi:Arm DNA-binding domain-containing protein [Sphingobium sufflavum]|nr:Arm DNA-binding domain-containing protein [Sphingobium sufflavum]